MDENLFKFAQYVNLLLKAAPGPPPRPGLQWKEETSRWIRPQFEEKDDAAVSNLSNLHQNGNLKPNDHGFVDSVLGQHKRQGHLSDKQWDILHKIHDKYQGKPIKQYGAPRPAPVAEEVKPEIPAEERLAGLRDSGNNHIDRYHLGNGKSYNGPLARHLHRRDNLRAIRSEVSRIPQEKAKAEQERKSLLDGLQQLSFGSPKEQKEMLSKRISQYGKMYGVHGDDDGNSVNGLLHVWTADPVFDRERQKIIGFLSDQNRNPWMSN